MAEASLEAGGQVILAAGALLAAGAAVSLVAERLRMPALLLFLGVGMAIGSDGAGLIEFGRRPEDNELTLFVGSLALAAILYEAGLDTGYPEIRPVLGPAVSLAVVGTFGTAAVTGLASVLLFDLPLLEGCCSARSSRPPTERPCSRAPAGGEPAAAGGAHARGRSRPQRPGRRAARARPR